MHIYGAVLLRRSAKLQPVPIQFKKFQNGQPLKGVSLNRASHAHGGSAGTSVRRLPCTIACLCSLQAGLKAQITIQLTRQAHAATHTPYGASPAKSPPSARLSASSSCQLSAGRGSSFLYLIHFIHHPSIPSFPYTNLLKFLLSCPRNVFSLEPVISFILELRRPSYSAAAVVVLVVHVIHHPSISILSRTLIC